MSFEDVQLSEQPANTRLQILLAKTKLSISEYKDANRLIDEITDWESVFDVARRNFSVPLLRHHLKNLNHTDIPSDVLERIEQTANASALQNLRMIAAQKAFQEQCLKPGKADALFFKGVNMAAQFYPDIGLRPCRDIDVLVRTDHLRSVLKEAIKAGYTPVSPEAREIPTTSERDINAILRLGESITLVSPERVVIDLQDDLDKHSGLFSVYDIFDNAKPFEVAGETFKTLPYAFLFNYIAHHHTRHTWSRLHWLSDLDAICTSKEFDRNAVLDMAESLGQRGTVEASLELHELMSTDTPWDDAKDLERGKSLLKLCILNLPGELDLEKRFRMKMIGGEFMYRWQARPDLLTKARIGWWKSVFKPTVTQYVSYPLPRSLQWLYVIPRILDLVQRMRTRLRPSRN